LDDGEISLAFETGFLPASFGPRILRTETAPVTALSLLQYLWGDF
jgi:16S rRNA (uracil1498-N3)-methyltransferase